MFRDNPAATHRSDSLIPGSIGHDLKTRHSNPEGRSTRGFWHPARRKMDAGVFFREAEGNAVKVQELHSFSTKHGARAGGP